MATIAVHDRTRHSIDPTIYGHCLEETGEGIHDGLWASSPRFAGLPRVDHARLNGIGPRAQRPVRRNGAWNRGFFTFIRSSDGVMGPEANKQLGTDDTGIVATPSYHAFQLFRQSSHEHCLAIDVASPAYTSRTIVLPPHSLTILCSSSDRPMAHYRAPAVDRAQLPKAQRCGVRAPSWS